MGKRTNKIQWNSGLMFYYHKNLINKVLNKVAKKNNAAEIVLYLLTYFTNTYLLKMFGWSYFLQIYIPIKSQQTLTFPWSGIWSKTTWHFIRRAHEKGCMELSEYKNVYINIWYCEIDETLALQFVENITVGLELCCKLSIFYYQVLRFFNISSMLPYPLSIAISMGSCPSCLLILQSAPLLSNICTMRRCSAFCSISIGFCPIVKHKTCSEQRWYMYVIICSTFVYVSLFLN